MILFIIFIVSSNILYSQLSVNDMSVSTGDEFELLINIESDDSKNEITFDLRIENPTLVYPLGISDNGQLIRKNDSTYTIIILSINNTISIKFEALAGNDSVCIIELQNILINGESFPNTRFLVKNNSTNKSVIYFRKPYLYDVYPNPIYKSETSELNFSYSVDKDMEIIVWLVNIKGELVWKKSLGLVNKGVHQDRIAIDTKIPTSNYWLVLNTGLGNVYKKIVMLK